jgi:hypothetical protein
MTALISREDWFQQLISKATLPFSLVKTPTIAKSRATHQAAVQVESESISVPMLGKFLEIEMWMFEVVDLELRKVKTRHHLLQAKLVAKFLEELKIPNEQKRAVTNDIFSLLSNNIPEDIRVLELAVKYEKQLLELLSVDFYAANWMAETSQCDIFLACRVDPTRPWDDELLNSTSNLRGQVKELLQIESGYAPLDDLEEVGDPKKS